MSISNSQKVNQANENKQVDSVQKSRPSAADEQKFSDHIHNKNSAEDTPTRSSIDTKKSNELLDSSARSLGLDKLSEDEQSWHKTMGQVYAYDKDDRSASKNSEALRKEVANASTTGDWSKLGINLVASDSKNMQNHPAAFAGGDTATVEDDEIIVNSQLLSDSKSNQASAHTLKKSLSEEVFHNLERKIYAGKEGDIQLNTNGELKFSTPESGASIDEGRLGVKSLENIQNSGNANISELLGSSEVANNDHGKLNDGTNVEFAAPKTLEQVLGKNANHSVHYRLRDNDWSMVDVNREFNGPEAFEKIWNHHSNDQRVTEWLEGEFGASRGAQDYVAWAANNKPEAGNAIKDWDALGGASRYLNQFNNANLSGNGITAEFNPHIYRHMSAQNLLGLEGSRAGTKVVTDALIARSHSEGDVASLLGQEQNVKNVYNKFTNAELSGSDSNIHMPSELTNLMPVKALVQLEGKRSGQLLVQKAVEEKLSTGIEPNKVLQQHFSGQSSAGSENNARKFLDAYTPDDIRTMSPRMLANMPQALLESGDERSKAALEVIQDAFNQSLNSSHSRKLSGGSEFVGWQGEVDDPFTDLASNVLAPDGLADSVNAGINSAVSSPGGNQYNAPTGAEILGAPYAPPAAMGATQPGVSPESVAQAHQQMTELGFTFVGFHGTSVSGATSLINDGVNPSQSNEHTDNAWDGGFYGSDNPNVAAQYAQDDSDGTMAANGRAAPGTLVRLYVPNNIAGRLRDEQGLSEPGFQPPENNDYFLRGPDGTGPDNTEIIFGPDLASSIVALPSSVDIAIQNFEPTITGDGIPPEEQSISTPLPRSHERGHDGASTSGA